MPCNRDMCQKLAWLPSQSTHADTSTHRQELTHCPTPPHPIPSRTLTPPPHAPLAPCRYPDLVVHRLLAAAIELNTLAAAASPSPSAGAAAAAEQQAERRASHAAASPSGQVAREVASRHRLPGKEEVQQAADHCNETKLSARTVQVDGWAVSQCCGCCVRCGCCGVVEQSSVVWRLVV